MMDWRVWILPALAAWFLLTIAVDMCRSYRQDPHGFVATAVLIVSGAAGMMLFGTFIAAVLFGGGCGRYMADAGMC